MKLSKVGAGSVAFAIAVAIFVVAPARVDSWNQGLYNDLCPANSIDTGACQPVRRDTDVTWGWALGNTVRNDGYGEMAYQVHAFDVLLAAIISVAVGWVLYLLLSGQRQRIPIKKIPLASIYKKAALIAATVGLVVLLLVPARVFTGITPIGVCGTGLEIAIDCEYETELMAGWFMNFLVTRDFADLHYRTNRIDVILGILAASAVTYVTYRILAERWRRGRT